MRRLDGCSAPPGAIHPGEGRQRGFGRGLRRNRDRFLRDSVLQDHVLRVAALRVAVLGEDVPVPALQEFDLAEIAAQTADITLVVDLLARAVQVGDRGRRQDEVTREAGREGVIVAGVEVAPELAIAVGLGRAAVQQDFAIGLDAVGDVERALREAPGRG